jgi:hypothetical protein
VSAQSLVGIGVCVADEQQAGCCLDGHPFSLDPELGGLSTLDGLCRLPQRRNSSEA